MIQVDGHVAIPVCITIEYDTYIRVVHFHLLFFISFWHLKIVCEMKKKKINAKRKKNI